MRKYRKVHIKRRKEIKTLPSLLGILFFAFLLSLILVFRISENLTPTLLTLADAKLNKYSTYIVNNAISQVLEDKIDTDSLFTITKNQQGEIQLIDFNPSAVNHILSVATTVVQENIRLLEEGNLSAVGIKDLTISKQEEQELKEGIIVSLPVGVATKVTFLSNLGPKIPIRFSYIGDVNSNITTKLTQYGMNNAMIEIGMHLEMTAQIYLPFSSDIKMIDCNIPLVIKMVQGTIPNFYAGGLTTNSNLYSSEVGDNR